MPPNNKNCDVTIVICFLCAQTKYLDLNQKKAELLPFRGVIACVCAQTDVSLHRQKEKDKATRHPIKVKRKGNRSFKGKRNKDNTEEVLG